MNQQKYNVGFDSLGYELDGLDHQWVQFYSNAKAEMRLDISSVQWILHSAEIYKVPVCSVYAAAGPRPMYPIHRNSKSSQPLVEYMPFAKLRVSANLLFDEFEFSTYPSSVSPVLAALRTFIIRRDARIEWKTRCILEYQANSDEQR